MAKRRREMNEQVRRNLKRDTHGITDSVIDQWLEWSQQRVADLHTFEEMRVRIYDPVINDCEVAWDAEASVTATASTTYIKRGTYASKVVIAAGHTTGLAVTDVIESTDFTDYTHVKFWIRSDVVNAEGGLQLMLDDTATCASPLETLDIPALEVDTWKECTLKLSIPTNSSSIISIGLNVVTDVGAQTIYIDEVRKVRCTVKDVARYSPPTDTKNILSIILQDGASSIKLEPIFHRLYDKLRPRLRDKTSDRPRNYIDYGSYFEVDPMPDSEYPLFIRYGKYPKAFSETSLVVEDCEDAWDAKSNVTCTASTTYVKLGTYSAKNIIAVGHTTGLAATEDMSAVDVSAYTHIKFWIRSDVANAEGDLQFILDDTSACASPLESLDIGALVPDQWSEQTLKFITPSNLSALLSVGLNVIKDNGAQTVYIDDVRVVTTSVSELLRKDQVIEAGATIYGFQFLRQEGDARTWNQIFTGMMKQVAQTDKSHEDLLQVARPFGSENTGGFAGNPWTYPEIGRF